MLNLHISLPLILLLSITEASTQDYKCDNNITPTPGDDGYKKRGNRCEGLFKMKTGGTDLSVLSLTTSVEDYVSKDTGELHILWPTIKWLPSDSTLNVLASWLKQRSYYQMDTRPLVSATDYNWDIAFIRSHIAPDDLAVLASIEQWGIAVYIPVTLALTLNKAPPPTSYKLGFLPNQNLNIVDVTITPVGPEGDPNLTLQFIKQLDVPPALAHQRLTIDLETSWFPQEGVYEIVVAAHDSKNQSVNSDRFYIFHSVRK